MVHHLRQTILWRSLIHSDLDKYVKIACRLKEGKKGDREFLLATLYSSGFNAFEEIQTGIIGYCRLEELKKDLIEDHVYRDPRFDEYWEFTQEIIESENWNEEWENNFQPVVISDQCRIKAMFHDPVPGYRYELTIHPKMAFGTGHHETTALMLMEIMELDVQGMKVLDVGCGTAILSILCSMKGADHIISLDNDKVAIESAAENIGLNSVKNIQLVEGEFSDITEKNFDLLLANINLNYMTGHFCELTKLVKYGGAIICSGFFIGELHKLRAVITDSAVTFSHQRVKNNWIVCTFIRNK